LEILHLLSVVRGLRQATRRKRGLEEEEEEEEEETFD